MIEKRPQVIKYQYRNENEKYTMVIEVTNGEINNFHLYLKDHGFTNAPMNRDTLKKIYDDIGKVLNEESESI